MRGRVVCFVFLVALIGSCGTTSSTDCTDYTSPALGSNSLRSPWSVASGPNQWLPSVLYDPSLATVQNGALFLECALDATSNVTYTADNSTYLAGAVKTDVALEYGFIDLTLQTSSSFWETVLQYYQQHSDQSFDYIIIGIAPTYIYLSVGVDVGSSSATVLDNSISLQGAFGPSFDGSLGLHNYSVLRTSINCAVYLDGTFVGGFSRSDLGGLWPFLDSDGAIPIYVMQSNLNSRAGENATALVTDLSATSLRCYEVDVGRLNDLDVYFPFGTADFILEAESGASLILTFSKLQQLSTASTYTMPVNPREWNRTSPCIRQGSTCMFEFSVRTNNITITATYTIYRQDAKVILGAEEVKVREGDFRLDLSTSPALPGSYRLETMFASSVVLQSNLSAANASSTLNLQAGPIAMNISFFEWSPRSNVSSLPRMAVTRTGNMSSTVTVDFAAAQQLTAFFRVAYSEKHRSWFRWWIPVAGVGGLLLLLGLGALIGVVVVRKLRKCLRRRRRREIELKAAKVVTA